MSFASTLQALRKEAGFTQEQLASKFGVSAQAVSKWENGSFPEGDLIPRIADEFGVSIDYLYGRDEKKPGIEQQVVNALQAIMEDDQKDIEERNRAYMEQIHRIMWAFHIGAWQENKYYYERPIIPAESGEVNSAILNGYGYSFMRLNKDHEYYIFLKQPEGDKGYDKWLEGVGKIGPMLELLADPASVQVILYMYTLAENEFVGAETVSKMTGVPVEKAEMTLRKLGAEIGRHSRPLDQVSVICGPGKDETVYRIKKTLSGVLLGVLALLDTYTNAPQSYALQISNRDGSWFTKLPDMKFKK